MANKDIDLQKKTDQKRKILYMVEIYIHAISHGILTYVSNKKYYPASLFFSFILEGSPKSFPGTVKISAAKNDLKATGNILKTKYK